MSTSFSPIRANFARTDAGLNEVARGACASAVATPPAKPSAIASGSSASASGVQDRSRRPARHGMAGPCISATATTEASVKTSATEAPGWLPRSVISAGTTVASPRLAGELAFSCALHCTPPVPAAVS